MPDYNPYINQYTYNPYPTINYQQRLQQMEQSYPHLTQQYQHPQEQTPALKGRPVTSLEEAKAAIIDYGMPYIFTDIANGKIYTKHMGVDGLAVLNIYALQQQQPEPTDEISTLRLRIDEMEQKIKSYEGMFLNGIQSNANISNASKQRKSNADASNDVGKQSAVKTSN